MLRFLIVLIAATPLLAHDMWIEPMTFSPLTGEIVGMRLRVGQDLLGDPLPRDPSLINQFIFVDGEGRKPLVGRDGTDPAGFLRVAAPGLMVVGYRSNPSSVEETPEKFNQYLKEEGLDSIAPASRKVRELFARCAKSLILSGSASEAQVDRTLGFPLELVAEKNPYALVPGERLPVRLTYENRPLAGALVIAINRLHPAEKLSARTGADGRVRLHLKPGGMWLIKAVHMIPAAAGTNADWASYWAWLTFGAK